MRTTISLLVIAVLVAYWPAQQGGYLWDDDDYIRDNKLLRTDAGLWKIWFEPGATIQYYPLVFTTFWAEFQIWHLEPMGFHLVNILLHGHNSILVYLLLRRLQVEGAWLAAAIFALHPVHVESVAWLTERKNVLSGFFYLSAFLAYLRFSPLTAATKREVPRPGAEGANDSTGTGPDAPGHAALSPGRGPWFWYALSLLLYSAALLSKSVTCSLPAVIAVVIWWKRGRLPTGREWCALAPMFLIGILAAWNTSRLERDVVGAQGPNFDFSLLERCLIAGRALWFYAWKLLVPYPLSFNYERWTIDANQPWQYLFPIGVVAVFWYLWARREKLGRGPLAACLIFAGTLLPALGFFNVYPMQYSFVADHFQYLASIALIALFAAWLCELSRKTRIHHAHASAVVFTLLGLLGFLTWRQCHDYTDVETLWLHTLERNPNSFLAYHNLGVSRMKAGWQVEAIHQFKQALRVNSSFGASYNGWSTCLLVLGMKKKGAADRAQAEAEQLRKEQRAEEAEPRSTEARAQRLEARKYFTQAAEKARLALDLENDNPRLWTNLALIHFKLEDYEAAATFARKALELAPTFERYNHYRSDFKKGFAPAEYFLGLALYNLKRLPDALPHLRRAAELQPSNDEYQQVLEDVEKESAGNEPGTK